MKYIILSASYHTNHCLRHEFSGESAFNDIVLTDAIMKKLESWNNKYFPILGGDEDEFQNVASIISTLDNEGMAIARAIQESSTERIKIKYYSEGVMQYLIIRS